MPLKIYFEDEFKLIDDSASFFRRYECISAGGGVVINDENKILMIFRRGKWDLPKGKHDGDETIEECAEREVKEETGLTGLVLEKFLTTTYHTYQEKGRDILKDTHWYLFRAHGQQDLTPQTEEDIMEIEWIGINEMENYTNNTYALIRDVLAEVISNPSQQYPEQTV